MERYDKMVGLQAVVFGLGVASVVLALRYICFFSHTDHYMARSMQGLLIEQVTSSVGTMLFSASSLLSALTGVPEQHWNNISPPVATTIRTIMFVAMLHATWRMSASINRAIREDEERRR